MDKKLKFPFLSEEEKEDFISEKIVYNFKKEDFFIVHIIKINIQWFANSETIFEIYSIFFYYLLLQFLKNSFSIISNSIFCHHLLKKNKE